VIEEAYCNQILETTTYGKVKTNAEYVYGDTDSVFFKFNLRDLNDEPIIGQKALEITIELAQQIEETATKFLKGPHKLEYEKTFLPFCLLSKKRYVGMLYETDPHKCKRKSMGIVLKRRDNAPIVKDIYGGIIDILMKEKNVEHAVEFLKGCLQNMVDEKYGMDKLVITKSLRSGYKNPAQIAHKVLADRIGRRDSGNKPSIGDRIPFVYIENPDRKALQGERIETPDYIIANKIKINYSFYITNQIMKPIQQVFALVLEDMKDFKKKKGHTLRSWKKELETLYKEYVDSETRKKKEDALRNKEVKALLFDAYLRKTDNLKNGFTAITAFYKK
jgi:DNA polymerase elongation subunit (family B)